MARGEDRGIALPHLDMLFGVGALGGLTDAQLLDRFTSRRDGGAELAFAALVERHGPMVLRTCRAVLRDPHDAQDAFQATFLVLARRAGSLWAHDSLGPWLHQVAYRTASCARSAAARRRRHERNAAGLAPRSAHDRHGNDLEGVVHEEVGRLPGRYREAIVLCLMEGLSPEQAAQQLGCPVGTVHSRLARARERLRGRLVGRGYFSSIAFQAWPGASSTALPRGLCNFTLKAAILASTRQPIGAETASAATTALVEGVIRNMFAFRLIKGMATLVAAAAFGLGMAVYGLSQEQGAAAPKVDAANRNKSAPPAGKTADERKEQIDQEAIQNERLARSARERQKRIRYFASDVEGLARRAREQQELGNTEDVMQCLRQIEFLTDAWGNDLTKGRWSFYTGKETITGEKRRPGDGPPPPPPPPMPSRPNQQTKP